MTQLQTDDSPAAANRAITQRWRGRSKWRISGVVALAFVALVVGLLALPGGKVVGDTTTNTRFTTIVPALKPGELVVQPILSSNSRLSTIYVTFGTYYGSARCDVRVSLRERTAGALPGTGRQIASQDWSCTQLPDSGRFAALQFAPIADSKGESFDVVVERTDSGAGSGVAIWAGDPKGDAVPALVDGHVQAFSTAIRGEYDPRPHRWDHMAQTLTRLAAYGPAWGSAGVFVGLVVLLGLLIALGPMVRRSTRTLAILVSLLALVRGLIWSAAVPALEGMDEPAHFANVQFLAEEHQFPGKVDNQGTFSARLFEAVAALNVESTTPGDRPDYSPGGEQRVEDEINSASANGGGGGPASMYAPFYYLPAAVLYDAGGGDFMTQIALARLWSVMLGVAAAVLLLIIGRQLFPRSSGAQLAFVIAGVLQPMIAHQFAIVNNDAWVIVAGFAALAVGLELARRGRAPGLAFLAGAVIGIGLLGKPFAIACVVPLAVGWLVGKVRARERSAWVIVKETGLILLGVTVTFGGWTLAAALLGLRTSGVPVSDGKVHGVRAFLEAQFGLGLGSARAIWADQMWGNFGWVRIPMPPPVPQCIFAIEIALLLGLGAWICVVVAGFVRRRRAQSASDPTAATIVRGMTNSEIRTAPLPLDVRILMIGVTIVGIIGTLYAAAWVYYRSTGGNDLLQGRYALLALPAFIAGPALLIERFSGGRAKPVVANTIAAACMIAANMLGLLVVLEAFYG